MCTPTYSHTPRVTSFLLAVGWQHSAGVAPLGYCCQLPWAGVELAEPHRAAEHRAWEQTAPMGANSIWNHTEVWVGRDLTTV